MGHRAAARSPLATAEERSSDKKTPADAGVFHAGVGTRSALAVVMLLAVDPAALVILRRLYMLLFAAAEVTVGAGARFLAVHVRLAFLEIPDLAIGQLARLNALLDALLLIDVALHVRLHALG